MHVLLNCLIIFFRPRDVYHTCYTLSGLSVVQHGTSIGSAFVVGTPRNELNTIHPLHNIAPHYVYNAMDYFKNNEFLEKSVI